MKKALNWVGAWLAAVVVTAGLGSGVQTQLNLQRLAALGADISAWTRIETTFADLLGFAPIWAIITGLGLLIALPLAGLVARLLSARSSLWHVLAGCLAPMTALLVMDALLPVTAIAAARTWPGLLAMSLPGALGGWLYFRLWVQRQKGQILYQAAQRNRSSQAGS